METADRLLVAEDDPLASEMIELVASSWGEVVVVRSIGEGIAAFDRVGASRWVAAILDVGLADGSGMELLSELRARSTALPVLVLTGRDERSLVNRAQAQRAEFAYKPVERENLEAFLRDAWGQRPNVRLDAATEALAAEWALTPRERDVVRLTVSGHSRDGVALILGVTENTLKTQIRHVLSKSGATSLESLVRMVLERAAGLSAGHAGSR